MSKFHTKHTVLINSILDEYLFTDEVFDDLWKMHNDEELGNAGLVCLNVTYAFEDYVWAAPNEPPTYPHLMCWLSKLFPDFGKNSDDNPQIIVEVHWR